MDKIFNDPPDWPTVKAEFERFKLENDLTNDKIAQMIGAKNGNSFRNNKAYKKVVTGIVRLWILTK